MNELEFVTLHRRHLHQYPELSLHEFETTSYITSFLEDLGVPTTDHLKLVLLLIWKVIVITLLHSEQI